MKHRDLIAELQAEFDRLIAEYERLVRENASLTAAFEQAIRDRDIAWRKLKGGS